MLFLKSFRGLSRIVVLHDDKDIDIDFRTRKWGQKEDLLNILQVYVQFAHTLGSSSINSIRFSPTTFPSGLSPTIGLFGLTPARITDTPLYLTIKSVGPSLIAVFMHTETESPTDKLHSKSSISLFANELCLKIRSFLSPGELSIPSFKHVEEGSEKDDSDDFWDIENEEEREKRKEESEEKRKKLEYDQLQKSILAMLKEEEAKYEESLK
ncbi:hypothetical protein ADUPG1_008647 [Aduncisulcus paluster]|uniref:Uncharacterized protein n=1 Tax=Aduncisulcus paluster TaxID=2918883 RepID=A0ABQ5KU29_9EUKA|nr:hypothetical protein ADUPG1_008647 [Aduncisulcus paluster]